MKETLVIWKTDIVLACLQALGEVTSRELREHGIKKPSNVIIRLKRRGYRIRSIKEHDATSNRLIVRYVLIEKDPPVLKVKRGETRFWKRR